MELADLKWRKSSYTTANGGDCVELARAPEGIAIRDSKDPEGTRMRIALGEFRRLVADVKEG